MAPTAPKKRTSMRSKVQRALTASSSTPTAPPPRKIHRPDSVVTDRFSETKSDKRLIKRSALINQIRAKAAAASTGAGVKKRRRPSKKLVANLESLAAALPELVGGGNDEEASVEAGDGGSKVGSEGLQQKSRQSKSLKSRPGALKRKEKLLQAETRNLGLNMAYLANLKGDGDYNTGQGHQERGGEDVESASNAATATAAAAPAPSTANRWAALRAHISTTMEHAPAASTRKA